MPGDWKDPDQYTLYLFVAILTIAAIAFWQIADALVFSVSIAVVAMPLHEKFSRRMNSMLSAALVTLVLFLLFIGVLAFAAILLLENQSYMSELFSSILSWVGTAQSSPLNSMFHINQSQINGLLGIQQTVLNQWTNSILQNIASIGFKIGVFFLTFSLFIYKGKEIYHSVISMLEGKLKHNVEKLAGSAVDTLYAIYIVQLIIVLITFLLAIPFFYFLGYGHVLFFGALAGLLKIVPVLGPSLLMAFLGVYAVSVSDTRGLLLLIFIGYPVVCAFPDLFIRPVLMGRRTCIHPVIMWVGFFVGLYTMGLVGFVLGPLILSLLINGYHIMKEDRTVCELGKEQ
jgi:predicted PurR-regulated permease PerM